MQLASKGSALPRIAESTSDIEFQAVGENDLAMYCTSAAALQGSAADQV